jgi:hypothetical protein
VNAARQNLGDTGAGRAAVVLATVTAVVLSVSVALNLVFTALPEVARVCIAVIVATGGIGSLVFGCRALMRGDRRPFIWTATSIGLVATLLLLAEFTILD